MVSFFKRLWSKLNEPWLEKALIILLPFSTFIIVALILAPSILDILSQAPADLPKAAGSAVETAAPSLMPAETEPGQFEQKTGPEEGEALVPDVITGQESGSIGQSGALEGWQNIAGDTYYYDSTGRPVTGLKSINGELYFFDQYGVKADALGIDVSFYNKFIDWPAVAAQGIDYAILRAGGRGWETGLIYEDVWFQRNLLEASDAGLDIGVYFFSTATNAAEAAEEASYVLGCLGGARLALPIFIDVEYSGDYPNGRADRLSNARREEIINSFCRTVMDSGYQAGVYSGENYYKYNLNVASLSKYTIWLASYTRSARLPDFPGEYDLWQFTDCGIVNGISGVVDMNASF